MKDVRHIFKHLPRTSGTRPKLGVTNELTYRAVHAEFLRKQGLTARIETIVPTAYVNQDRLVIDCLCGNGVPVLRSNFAACVGCGRIYRNVAIAEDVDLVAAVLDSRPEVNRNWDPRRGETLEDMEDENRERGLPVPTRPPREPREGGR